MAKLGKNAQRILKWMRQRNYQYGAHKGHQWVAGRWQAYGNHDWAGCLQLVQAGLAEVIQCRELPSVHHGGGRFNPHPIHELVIKLKEEQA